MTKPKDWADKAALRLDKNIYGEGGANTLDALLGVAARALRAAYKRGAKDEREACAEMMPSTIYGRAVAKAIRERNGVTR
jgi:hypothetical protein